MNARFLATGAALLGACLLSVSAHAETGIWKEQRAKLNYFGMTTLYTCDGLESKLKQVLQLLGARGDMRVRVTGCPYGSHVPTKTAWVDLRFHTLQPGGSSNADGIPADWQSVELAPNRPSSMGAGECELIDMLKKTLKDQFSSQDLDIRASCFPGQIGIADYHVKGKLLKATRQP